MNETQDILNKIQRNRTKNEPIFEDGLLDSVHKKVVDSFLGKKESKPTIKKGASNMNEKVELVIAKDRKVREAVQNLVVVLSDLGDKEIAMKLIGEHIMFLNDMFREFDASEKK